MTGMAGCCARAGSIHTAAPLDNLMKSRRLMRSAFRGRWLLRTEPPLQSHLGMLMGTSVTRPQHSGDGLRDETDLTDAEWALIEPLMPAPTRRRRPRAWLLREIRNAIFYVLLGGIVSSGAIRSARSH